MKPAMCVTPIALIMLQHLVQQVREGEELCDGIVHEEEGGRERMVRDG